MTIFYFQCNFHIKPWKIQCLQRKNDAAEITDRKGKSQFWSLVLPEDWESILIFVFQDSVQLLTRSASSLSLKNIKTSMISQNIVVKLTTNLLSHSLHHPVGIIYQTSHLICRLFVRHRLRLDRVSCIANMYRQTLAYIAMIRDTCAKHARILNSSLDSPSKAWFIGCALMVSWFSRL